MRSMSLRRAVRAVSVHRSDANRHTTGKIGRSPMIRKFASSILMGAVVLPALLWAVPATAARGSTKTITVKVTAGKPTEYKFTFSTRTFKHQAVLFRITNHGKVSHSFEVCSSWLGGSANSCSGEPTRPIAPGRSTTLLFTFAKKGKYEFLDTVKGHAALGMKGLLVVT
jgi:uncharacterized cupredoxin-like copper-binding protein